MSTKKLILILMSCLVAFSILLTACGGAKTTTETTAAQETSAAESTEATTAAEEKIDPFGKFAEPVEITACRILTSWMSFEEGENENNNWWTQTYLDKLNVKLNVVWTAPNWGPEYDQKIATSIATDDIPDLLPVYDKLARQLVEAGKTADITEAYNKYASPLVKETMGLVDGLGIKASTANGKMFGIGNPEVVEPDAKFIWIRKDWLDKLGLQAPTNFAELTAVAKAFVEQDPDGDGKKDTYAFAMNKDLAGEGDLHNGFFPMFHAYPSIFIEKDGKLEPGNIQPEMKEGLKQLAAWYKDGLIAKDFAVKRPNDEMKADIAAGKVGIFFSGNNTPNSGALLALKKNEPDLELIHVPLFSFDGKPVKQSVPSRIGNFAVVGYKCKNPEAVVKMINLSTQIFSSEKPDFITDGTYDWTKNGHMNFWNALFNLVSVGRNYQAALKAQDAMAGKIPAADLKFDAKTWYDRMNSWKTEGTKAKEFDVNWSFYAIYGPGGSEEYKQQNLYKDMNSAYLFDKVWGPEPPTQVKNGTDWSEKSKEYFIKAIMTGNVDQEFDNWVNYYKTNGGDQAIQEANDWYTANK